MESLHLLSLEKSIERIKELERSLKEKDKIILNLSNSIGSFGSKPKTIEYMPMTKMPNPSVLGLNEYYLPPKELLIGDLPLVYEYLNSKYMHNRRKTRTWNNQMGNLKKIYEYIQRELNIDSVTKITQEELEDFFLEIEELTVTRNVKLKLYGSYRRYFEFILKGKKYGMTNTLDEYFNQYSFDPRRVYSDMGETRNIYDFTIENRVKAMLDFFKLRDYRSYVMFLFLATTGIRIGALANIRKSNLDLVLRKVEAQDKRTENNSSGWNSYIIPIPLVPILKGYLLHLPKDQEILFNITDKQIRKIFREQWAKDHVDTENKAQATPHALRHAISLQWAKKGLVEAFRASLLNQTPEGGVNSRVYTQLKSFSERKRLFDENFPYWDLF